MTSAESAVHGLPEEGFSTSGQSGKPVVWYRTIEQLHAEATLLAQTIIGEIDRVVNYAPTNHIYGRLFGDILPNSLGIPVQQVWDSPLTVPELATQDRVLLVCLPSTWLMLRSIASHMEHLANVTAVHSTGPSTPAMHRLLARLEGTGFRVVEILGSTETGGVAHRTLLPRQEQQTRWALFSDVKMPPPIAGAMEQRLRIRSPRIARRADMARPPEEIALDDLIHPVDERSFELLGRATRMIKVNGRRVRLEDIEAAVRERFPHADAVCLARKDEVRAEHYELFYVDGADGITVQEIYDLIAEDFPSAPMPRRVQRVAVIPRSSVGKIRIDRLLAAARSASEMVKHAP